MRSSLYTLKFALIATTMLSLDSIWATPKCVHMGDGQSAGTSFTSTLQNNLNNYGIQLYSYTRPFSKSSYWTTPGLSTKDNKSIRNYRFSNSANQKGKERVIPLHDNDDKSWAESILEHHSKDSSIECVIVQFGDYPDDIASYKKMLKLIQKHKSRDGQCYWVAPTWSNHPQS